MCHWEIPESLSIMVVSLVIPLGAGTQDFPSVLRFKYITSGIHWLCSGDRVILLRFLKPDTWDKRLTFGLSVFKGAM